MLEKESGKQLLFQFTHEYCFLNFYWKTGSRRVGFFELAAGSAACSLAAPPFQHVAQVKLERK
jgi:hypothetical protein